MKIRLPLNLLYATLLLTLHTQLFSKDIYVSNFGNDTNAGTFVAPYRTVNKAASLAVAGDTVIIRGGIYREHVKPVNGGTSETARIVYKSADGEYVRITGSEQITSWVNEGNGVWRADIPTAFFNGYNPYTLFVSGDYLTYGGSNHLGNVYLNNQQYWERLTLAEVQATAKTWFTSTSGSITKIWANFGSNKPNDELCEINTRQTCFYPDIQQLNYITVEGIHFRHAANNWAPPTNSEQIGMVMPRYSKKWIIQNCEVEHAKTVGISIGKHTTNAGPYTDIDGHHIIRNNVIRYCGQNGISGSLSTSVCLIENNLIEYTNFNNEFGGWETAGIKVHHSVDTIIRGNVIRDVKGNAGSFGIWIDWANQGTRITGNVILETWGDSIYLEAGFGPILVDNNIFY